MPRKLLALLLLIIALFALVDLSHSARMQFELAFGTPVPDAVSLDVEPAVSTVSTAVSRVADTLTADAAAVVPSELTEPSSR